MVRKRLDVSIILVKNHNPMKVEEIRKAVYAEFEWENEWLPPEGWNDVFRNTMKSWRNTLKRKWESRSGAGWPSGLCEADQWARLEKNWLDPDSIQKAEEELEREPIITKLHEHHGGLKTSGGTSSTGFRLAVLESQLKSLEPFKASVDAVLKQHVEWGKSFESLSQDVAALKKSLATYTGPKGGVVASMSSDIAGTLGTSGSAAKENPPTKSSSKQKSNSKHVGLEKGNVQANTSSSLQEKIIGTKKRKAIPSSEACMVAPRAKALRKISPERINLTAIDSPPGKTNGKKASKVQPKIASKFRPSKTSEKATSAMKKPGVGHVSERTRKGIKADVEMSEEEEEWKGDSDSETEDEEEHEIEEEAEADADAEIERGMEEIIGKDQVTPVDAHKQRGLKIVDANPTPLAIDASQKRKVQVGMSVHGAGRAIFEMATKALQEPPLRQVYASKGKKMKPAIDSLVVVPSSAAKSITPQPLPQPFVMETYNMGDKVELCDPLDSTRTVCLGSINGMPLVDKLHCVTLKEGWYRLLVDEVLDPECVLPMPNKDEEFYVLKQVANTNTAWAARALHRYNL